MLPENELLDISAIYGDSKKYSRPKQCGIYFLFRDEELLYVGQSTGLSGRICQHAAGHIPFNRVSIIYCEPESLNDLEAAYILKYKPPFNGGNESKPRKMFLAYRNPPEGIDLFRVSK